jgi:hypothetical protein
VSYRLRMSVEIGEWLAEATAAEPVAAAELGAALVVLAEATELPGPPLVADLADDQATPKPDAADPREAADKAYQDLLEVLQHVRREVADAATRRERLRRLRDGESDATDGSTPSEEELTAAVRREQELTQRSQRLQSAVDAVRTQKETAKAMYTAAEASLNVHAAMAAVESSVDWSDVAASGPESAAKQDDDEVAELHRALDAAQANLKVALTQARLLLREIRDADSAEPREPDGHLAGKRDDVPVPGLLELRADPLGTDIRVLLAAEPAGTMTLLAVLDGADAIDNHRDEAIALAGELLTEIRDGNWPPGETEGTESGEVCFDDAATLLTKLFPDRGAAVRARAAELADLGTLAGLRRERELSIADIAASTGLAEDRVWEIEHTGLQSVELHEAAAYVRALGGRLDLTATFGSGEQTSLS